MGGVAAVVTGLGPVSAIGSGRTAFWDALVAGRHGIGPITLCDASASPSKIGAEVRDFDLDTYVEHGGVLGRHTPRSRRAVSAFASSGAPCRSFSSSPE